MRKIRFRKILRITEDDEKWREQRKTESLPSNKMVRNIDCSIDVTWLTVNLIESRY